VHGTTISAPVSDSMLTSQCLVMDTARSQHKLTTLDATVDPPQEWCDSPEGSDMDSTPTGVPRVTKPPHVQSTPRSLLDTFSLEMDSSVSEAELPIQGTDKNKSLSDAWESQAVTTASTGSIIDSGAGRHICNLVNLTDKDSIKRLRVFNGTLEHTSGKGYKPIKVSTDAGDELHWDIKDKDYFQADTTEQSMCKLSPKPTSLVAKIGTTVDVSSHDAKHHKDIIMQVLQSSKNDNDDTLHSDWNIPTGNVFYNISCEA
jgi:hypothetical protein